MLCFMIEEKELSLKLETLKETIPKQEWHYYNLHSIENFIYHLNDIKSERTREKTAVDINNYLELVSKKINENSTTFDKGKALFQYLWPICDIYKYEVGFIRRPDFLITPFLFILLFFFLRLPLYFLQALIISVACFVIYLFYGFLKIKSKKVY